MPKEHLYKLDKHEIWSTDLVNVCLKWLNVGQKGVQTWIMLKGWFYVIMGVKKIFLNKYGAWGLWIYTLVGEKLER